MKRSRFKCSLFLILLFSSKFGILVSTEVATKEEFLSREVRQDGGEIVNHYHYEDPELDYYPDGYEKIHNQRLSLARQALPPALGTAGIVGAGLLLGGFADIANSYYSRAVDSNTRETCSRVNSVLNIAPLEGTSNDQIIPPTANYILANPVLTQEGTGAVAGLPGSTGLSVVSVISVQFSMPTVTPKSVALSLGDFDILRMNTADALTALDKKIDEILNIQTLSC